jgi:hypothetical protein
MIQHGCTQAVFVFHALKNSEIDAMSALLPKSTVIGNFRKWNGHKSQGCVHLHNGRAGGNAENVGLRI